MVIGLSLKKISISVNMALFSGCALHSKKAKRILEKKQAVTIRLSQQAEYMFSEKTKGCRKS